MSNKSLAYRLGIYISLAVLLVYLVLIIWSYRHSVELTRENAENRAINLSEQVVDPINQHILSVENLASAISGQIPLYSTSREPGEYFKMLLEEHPYVDFIQVRIPSNTGIGKGITWTVGCIDSTYYFSDQSSPGLPCSDVVIPDDSVHHLKSGWSEPNTCQKNGRIFTVYYHPFETMIPGITRPVRGYVGCALSLDFLQRMLNAVKIGEKGYAFLASANGICITYPLKEMVLHKSLLNLPSEVYRGDMDRMMSYLKGESGPITVFPAILGYKKAWAFPTRVEETGWVLSFVMPWSELYHDIRLVLYRMIAISLVVTFLIFLLVFYISQQVMHPLSRVSEQLHTFSSGKPGQIPKPGNETVSLQESLSRLQKMHHDFLQHEEESNLRSAHLAAELEIASEIQRSIIPPPGNHLLFDRKVSIFSVFRPAQAVGGDLYDFFMIDDHRMVIVIGDVSGGGVPAAIFMGIAHSYIKSHALIGTAKDIVNQVNKELCKNNNNQFFLTLFVGILDTRKDMLNYCNAGHVPSYLISATGEIRDLGEPHGLPPGLYPERNYLDASIPVRQNDLLILYTDGVTDSPNQSGDFYGVANFRNLFLRFRDHSPEEISGIIMHHLDAFTKETPRTDDLSLMVIRYQYPWSY